MSVLGETDSQRAQLSCHSDNGFGRIIELEAFDQPNTTVDSCVDSCQAQNFSLAGLEFSVSLFIFIHMRNLTLLYSQTQCCMSFT